MGAMEEHVNRALIELYFAIAELESSPFSTRRTADEQQRRAIASALQVARTALETSTQLAGASFHAGAEDETKAQPF